MHRMQRLEGLVLMCLPLILVGAGCAGAPKAPGAVESPAARLARELARKERELRAALASAEVTPLDPLDARLLWSVETDQGDPADLALTAPKPGTTDRAMAVRFRAGPKKKIVLGCYLATTRDLSKQNALLLDVASALQTDAKLSLALLTMPGWKYFESPAVAIKPGPNKDVVFRLDEATFKSEASQWKPTARVAGLSVVRKMVLIVHSTGGGSVVVDNLRTATFKPAPPAPGKK